VGTSASEKSERRLGDASRRPLAPLSATAHAIDFSNGSLGRDSYPADRSRPCGLLDVIAYRAGMFQKQASFPSAKSATFARSTKRHLHREGCRSCRFRWGQCLPRVGTRNGHQWSARRPFRPAPGVNASRAERSNREQARCRHYGNGRRLLVRRDPGKLRNRRRRRRRRRRTISRIVFGHTGWREQAEGM